MSGCIIKKLFQTHRNNDFFSDRQFTLIWSAYGVVSRCTRCVYNEY